MEENKQNKESGQQKKELTPQQRQKRMKLLIYPLFVLLFAGSMWLIFAPSTAMSLVWWAHGPFINALGAPENSAFFLVKKY